MKSYYTAFFFLAFFHAPAFALTPENTNKSQAETPKYNAITKKQYKTLLSGNTIKGEYRHMRERTKTYNFTEHHNPDGSTEYTEGEITARGLWYTVGERKICYKYPDDKQMGGNTSCFWVYNAEGCYYGYSLYNMTLNGPKNYEDWDARWILGGSGGSCAAAIG